MIVGIIGSRNCGNLQLKDIIRQLPEGCKTIASGGAKGVDSMAKQAAKSLGINFQEFLPEYEKYGKRAPLLRNEQLVAYADLMLVFWDFQSKGTANAIAHAIRQSVPVFLYPIQKVPHSSPAKELVVLPKAEAQKQDAQKTLGVHWGE